MKSKPQKTVARLSAKPSVRQKATPISKAETKVDAKPITTVNHSWTGKPKTKKNKGGYGFARDWQRDAYAILRDDRFVILNAPTGSGKSWLMCLLSTHKMEQDPKLRTIISVPQSIIANGFLDLHVILPDNEHKIHWKPKHNLCDGKPGTVDRLYSFLKDKQTEFNDRIAICTHATLVHLHKRLKQSGELRLLNNVQLWVDEAHHVQNADFEDTEGMGQAIFSNGIGELVKHVFNSKKNVHLGLATASFFRGDRTNLLTDKMEEKFTRFNLPYDQYFESMEHLRSFSFSFKIYTGDFMPAVEEILASERKKTLIHFPPPNSNCSRRSMGKDKYDDVKDLLKVLNKTYNKKDSPPYRWLDLVNEEGREAKKEFTQTINEDRDKLDCISSIAMFKEGSNWIWAERTLKIGYCGSLVELMQTAGRLFRDAPGKSHVEFIQLLPFSIDQSNRTKFRESLNNNIKAVLSAMILENILVPSPMKPPKGKRKRTQEGQGALPAVEGGNAVQTYFPDENDFQALVHEGHMEMLTLADESKRKASKGDYIDLMSKLVKKKRPKIPKDAADEIGETIVRMGWKAGKRMEGIDVSNIDFDVVTEVNPVDWIVNFTTGACGVDTFKKLRLALSQDGTIPMSEEMHYRLVNKLIDDGHMEPTSEAYREMAGRFNAKRAGAGVSVED